MQIVRSTSDNPQQDEYYITRLAMSKCTLLMPQSDVISVESVYDLETGRPQKMSVGSISIRGKMVPVYALSSSLGLLLQIPDRRTQCALIRHSEGEYFVLCEDVSNYQTKQISFHEIPVCMRRDSMPLTHLALYSMPDQFEQLGMITNGDALFHSIATQIQDYRHD